MPILLAFTAAAADTISFLTLSHLFTAHVTGNFVILGAALVLHQPVGMWSKIAAVPVFFLGILLAGIAAERMPRGRACLLLGCELLLLLGACAITLSHGPFKDADAAWPFSAAMLMVLAMAVQNAFGPLALPKAPPTTALTSSTTLFFVDLAQLLVRPAEDRDSRHAASRQARRIGWQILGFLLGCAAAAGCVALAPNWSLLLPIAGVAASLGAMVLGRGR